MAKYVFTLAAAEELDAILETITEDNPSAAAQWFVTFKEKCTNIAAFPRIGRLREDLLPGVYVFPYGNYLIFYRIRDNGVEILHVIHGARDIQDLPI